MSPLGRWGLGVAALAVALGRPSAGASTYDIFGVSGRDVGMGGAMTAGARGVSAMFYNPALLTANKQQHLSFGVTLTAPDLFIDRGRPDSAHESVKPGTHVGLSLGWVKPLPGIFEERLGVGVSIYTPANRLLRIQGVEPQRPQFYLYQNLQDKLLINLALGGDVLEWLSVGVGVHILADVTGGVALDMNILSKRFERRALDVKLAPSASPIVGVALRPSPELAIGLSYRGQSALRFALPVLVSEGEALSLAIDVSQTVLYTPHQLSLGLAYEHPQPAIRVALDATWALWSGAPDPSPRLSVDIGGKLLEAFGLAGALDLSRGSRPIPMGFSDTLVVRAGVEWAARGWLALRGGYFFRPTPAPRQTGVSSYLDNDAHVMAFGMGVEFLSPLAEVETPEKIELDLAVQLSVLPRRTVHRPDPHDPVGGLSHGGMLWTVTTTLHHTY